MGVFALTTFCNEDAENASESVNLSAEAARLSAEGNPPLTLLVDGLAFFHEIIENTSPGWEWVLGGNYPAIAAAIETKVAEITAAGVQVSIFLDPAPGTEGVKKAHELDLRFRQRAKNMARLMQLLHEGEELHEWEDEEVQVDWSMPPLASKQAVHTLKKMGIPVRTCEREADEELGQHLVTTAGAYGIVSSDSDFFLMSGTRYLPLNHLKIVDGQVWARVFTPESVGAALGLSSNRLSELAALCGNDITGEYLDKHSVPSALQIPALHIRNKGTRCKPKDVAAFLAALPEEQALADHPLIQSLTASDAAFADALKANTDFYAREGHAAEASQSDEPLGQLLASGLRDCSLPGSVLAVSRHGVYMSSVKVEAISAYESPIDSTLRPLRRVLYSFLAPGRTVSEHVREGQRRVTREVEALAPSVLEAAAGSADLLVLRAMDEHKRSEILHVLAHLVVDHNVLVCETCSLEELVAADPLCSLPETIMVVIGDQVKEVCYGPVGLVLRQALLLQAPPADELSSAGIVMSSWDFECLLRTAFLLGCGVECDHLPRHCPNARAVEVAAYFLAVYSSLQSLAQLLDLPSSLPEPALLFDGRLYAHLHSHSEAAVALLRKHEDDLPKDEIDVLRKALLGVFKDPTTVLCELGFEGEGFEEDAPQEILGHGSVAAAGDPAAAPSQGVASLNLETLPIHEHRERILQCVEANQVTCIQGETGCGKSSMVPQFLVEHAVSSARPVKVVVTQPRRLAAVTLARRVASQRGEEIGNSVGYRIGHGDHVDSPKGLVTFVTVGYFLQFLSHNPHHFSRYSHIVIDEVHERSMDTDLLNLLIKKLLEQKKVSTRLIVMSATLQSGLFGEYFTPAGHVAADPIFVGARRFPVQDIFLEELVGAIPALRNKVGTVVNRVVSQFEMASKATDTKGKLLEGAVGLVKPEVSPDGRRILVESVLHLAQPGSCILVFLPGIGEIASMQDDLDQAQLGRNCQAELQILVLHSLVPKDEQEAAMAPAKPGCCKVILSTNIAESSITIPDARFVIDTGLHRGIFYDDKRQMPSLLCTWCAQASARQRAGRTGRVAPGTIIYLFTREFHSVCMPDFDEAEILRVPLEKTVLRVKLLLSRFGSVTDLLQQSVTPPPPPRVLTAIKVLYQAGALTTEKEDGEVSELGRLAADMPVDLPLVKLLLLGRAFGCLTDAVVMAAALTLQDPFLMPSNVFMRDQGQYIRELQNNLVARAGYDKGAYSEPLAYLEVYKAWMHSDKQVRWARSEGLSHARMRQLDMLVADLSSKMQPLLGSSAQDAALLGKLSRLYSSSRRTGHQREDTSGAGGGPLFNSNLNLLRFVLAGACAPIFLQGAVQPSASSKDLKELAKTGFEVSRSVVLARMPKDICNERALGNVLRAAGIQLRQGGFKQLSDDRAAVEVQPHRVDGIKPHGGSGSEKLVSDVSLYVKLLIQLHVSTQRKLVLPNPRGVSGGADATILIKGLSVERQVSWQLAGISGMQVLPYWRAPLASLSDLDERNSHRFGVALSLLGTEQELKVRAIGVTVLPEGLFSKVLQVIFTPPDQQIRVCCDEDHEVFFAATIGSSMVSFEPAVLSLQDMGSINHVRRIVSDAIAGGGGQQPQSTLEALLALLMRPPESLEKQKGRSKVKRKWVPCSIEESVDYLPQVRLNFDRVERVDIGGGGAAREATDGNCVRIALLCSDDFNVSAQLPPGYWIDTREECESGTHSWHEICFKKVESDAGKFKDQMLVLFKWFKGATVFDRHAVLEFPSILSNDQRKLMHDMAQRKMDLATHSSGPKSDRRLMLCRDMNAIKHIQKRGGVASVAQGGGTLNIGKKNQAPAPKPASPLASIKSQDQLIAALKPLVHACLMDFHPQGLLLDALPSEFENKYGEPIPLQVLGKGKVRVRELLDLIADVVAIVPGVMQSDGRPGKDRVVATPSSAAEAAATAPNSAAAPSSVDISPQADGSVAEMPAANARQIPQAPAAAHASRTPENRRADGNKKRGGELESVLRERIHGVLAKHARGLSATKIEEALSEMAGKKVHLGKDGKDRKAFLLGFCGLREDSNRYFLPGAEPPSNEAGASASAQEATMTGIDDKGRLHAMCQKRKLGAPQYKPMLLPNGQWESTLLIAVEGVHQRIVGRGQKKVVAEQAAAQLAIAALEGKTAPVELQTCQDCGAVGPGDVDVTDGNYYCMQCWEAFNAAAKVEEMTLHPTPQPRKHDPKLPKPEGTPELSKDEKLLSYLGKEEAMVAVLRKAVGQASGGALGLQEAHSLLEGVRSHGAEGLSPGVAALAHWLMASQGQVFVLQGKGSGASICLKG